MGGSQFKFLNQGSPLEIFEKELKIRPLIFSGKQSDYQSLRYVKPYQINKEKPPITAHDVKEIKTYLNAIKKCRNSYYKAKRKVIKKIKKTSKDEEQAYEEEMKKYQAQKCEKFEKKLRDNSMYIEYDSVSKKSLEKAISIAEQTAKKYKKKNDKGFYEDFQEYIKYLRYLYSRKTISADISLTQLEKDSKANLDKIVKKLNFPTTDPELKKYLPKELAGLLKELFPSKQQVTIQEFDWENELGFNLDVLDMCKEYDEMCTKLVGELKAANKAYEDKITMDLHLSVNGLAADSMVAVYQYQNEQSTKDVSLKTARDALLNAAVRLDELIKESKEAVAGIAPFAEKLYESAAKAKVYGLSTLYTRLSDDLDTCTTNLTNKLMSVSGTRKELLTVAVGLDRVTVSGMDYVATKEWSSVLEIVDGLNLQSEKYYNKLDQRDIIRDKNALATSITEVEGSLKQLNYALKENLKADKVEKIKRSLKSPDAKLLNDYVIKMSNKLSDAEEGRRMLQQAYATSKRVLGEAKKSLIGKILLFKEKHKTGLETLKGLASMAETLTSKI